MFGDRVPALIIIEWLSVICHPSPDEFATTRDELPPNPPSSYSFIEMKKLPLPLSL